MVVISQVDNLYLAQQKTVRVEDSRGHNALHYAASHGQIHALNLLIEAGCPVDAQTTKNGWTPLMIAAMESSLRCVHSLVQAGADIQVRSMDQKNALHYAAMQNNWEVMDFLLFQTTLLWNARDVYQNTPLHLACNHDSVLCVQRLLDCPGIEIDGKDSVGNTPLDIARARHSNPIVHALVSAIKSKTDPNCDETLSNARDIK